MRRNALQLLVDAFPLHDPDATQVPAVSELLLMYDDDERVCTAGCLGPAGKVYCAPK